MSATIHRLRPFRLIGKPCGNGTTFAPPCRDIADLPEDLRERVNAARGLTPSETHGDNGAAGGAFDGDET
jgi:hypothetical protein